MAFDLKQIVPWGRSFREYTAMFGLTENDLRKNIVSCGDGPAGFNAEMRKQGHRVISCDPLYKYSAEEIKAQIDKTYDKVLSQLKANKKDFVWKTFKTPAETGRARMHAMQSFLADYGRGKREGRYIAESLPKLSFTDSEFDLALSSHFLFLYTAKLSLRFHLKAVTEMCRIAKEVRIFPLLDLGGKESSYLKPIITKLKKQGFEADIRKVDYEFQRGGNKMLRIHRPPRMEHRITHMAKENFLVIKTSGRMNADDFITMAKDILQHPSFLTNGNALFDHTSLDFKGVPLRELDKIRAFHMGNERTIGGGRSAILVKTGLAEAWHNLWAQGKKIRTANKTRVFENKNDALDWLKGEEKC